MNAVEIKGFGAPEVLVLAERPDPTPGAGEVLVRVAASGVNRPDVLQRKGAYAPPPGASDLPGLEFAGEIVAGDSQAMQAAGFKLGERVCALVAGGGYAQLAVAPVSQCLPVPKGLSDIEAAGLPETFFTVWSNVFDRAHLRAGDTLLVQGGSSGIGVTAIQLGKAFGARVIVTAGSADKCQACVDLGAERAVNYKEEDFAKVLSDIDLILDMIAGDYTARNIEVLAPRGRLVQIAVQQGANVTINMAKVMMKRLTLTGSTMRPRTIAEKAAIARELQEQVWPLLESGAVKVLIDRVFPLAEAAAAHHYLDSGTHIGKVILAVS